MIEAATRRAPPRAFQRDLFEHLEALFVDETVWFATDRPEAVMSTVARAKQRRPRALRDRKFTCATWTAIQHRSIGNVQVLVQITRTA